jgi:hypothetical protein
MQEREEEGEEEGFKRREIMGRDDNELQRKLFVAILGLAWL